MWQVPVAVLVQQKNTLPVGNLPRNSKFDLRGLLPAVKAQMEKKARERERGYPSPGPPEDRQRERERDGETGR